MPPIRHNKEGDRLHNQNASIPTKPPCSSISSKLKHESETRSETKQIEWKVKNILSAIQVALITHPNSSSLEIDVMRFTAGDSIDMSSEWELCLKYGNRPATTNSTDNNGTAATVPPPPPTSPLEFGIVLRLLDYKGDSENVLAGFIGGVELPNGAYRGLRWYMKDWKLGNPNWGSVYIPVTTYQELKTPNVLRDGAFTTYMTFTIYQKNRVQKTSPVMENEKCMKVARDEIMKEFEKFLEDGTCSDFTIKIPKPGGENDGYETFQVHKMILAARSSVFKAMFEAQMQEKKTGEVVITDVSPLAMKILLKFIYTGILDDEWILTPQEVILAADKYHLATMKDMCEKKFVQVLTPSNALQMMKLSKTLNLQKVSKLVMEYVKLNLSDICDKA